MAASITGACGRCPILFSKAVYKTKVHSLCEDSVKVVSTLPKYLICSGGSVTPKKGKNSLPSTCHRRDWSPNVFASSQAAAQMARSVEFSHISGVTFISKSHTCLFPLKRQIQTKRTVFQCRYMSSEEAVRTDRNKATHCDHRGTSGHTVISNPIRCSGVKSQQEVVANDRTIAVKRQPEKKENIKTIPNLLTTLRMASAPLLGYLVVCESFGWALSLFAVAGITDMLDGYIARKYPNQISALGSALDPLADKLLVTILFVSMTSVGLIPLPLTGLIVFRDVSLITGGFYIRYRSLPPPITLSRYFDVAHATVSLAPTFISKLNTGLQLSLVACSLAAPVFGFVDHICLQVLWWATGATTFMSGADYMWSWKKYVTLLEKDQNEL